LKIAGYFLQTELAQTINNAAIFTFEPVLADAFCGERGEVFLLLLKYLY